MAILLSNSRKVLSVITVSKNDSAGLRLTLKSIATQNFDSWNCVVVLPNENDVSYMETKKLVEYDNRFQLLIQKSPGIYEAMNLALDNVKTKYVWFMNGGDQFLHKESIQSAINLIQILNADLLIGGYQYYEGESIRRFVRKAKKLSPRSFSLNRRSGCHQSMLFKLGESDLIRFDTRYLYAADFKFVLDFLKLQVAFRTDEVFCQIEPGGVSSAEILNVLKEKKRIRSEVFADSKTDLVLGDFWTVAVLLKILMRNVLRRNLSPSKWV
jgi:glycosyltransferase involved in cell wall biosynthesis